MNDIESSPVESRKHMQASIEPDLNTGSDIDSSDESVYDGGANSPFRRYVSSQGRRIRVSESASEGEGEQSGEIKRVLDFSRAKRLHKEESISWLEASSPATVDELGVHTRKVADLRQALRESINGQCEQRMIVVSGPSGSGKSTTTKLLIKELMREKAKRSNAASVSALGSTVSTYNEGSDNCIVEFSISSDSHVGNSSTRYFAEFMDQCKSLTGVNERCVVVEELPNVFHTETHREFQRVIQEWICTDPQIALPPLVLILSEFDIAMENEWRGRAAFTVDNFVRVETVSGRSVMSLENILWKRVRFNRVARTILKKASQRVLNIQGVTVDETGVRGAVEALCGLGDLRNSINELEFWYTFKRESSGSVVGEGRESGRETFHAIGKIVYGTKHEENEISEFCKRFNVNGRRDVDVDLATAANVSIDIGCGTNVFNLSCLENYGVLQCAVNEQLCESLDVFGGVDKMLGSNERVFSSGFAENVGFYSCYGLRVMCSSIGGAGGSNKKLVFSRDPKLQRKMRLMEQEMDEYAARRRSRLFMCGGYAHLSGVECATVDGYYGGVIMGSFKAKQRIYEQTGKVSRGSGNDFRIGGEFTNSITAEEGIDVDEESDDGRIRVRGQLLKELEDAYFAVKDDGTDGEDEFDSDPIENSDDAEFADELELEPEPEPEPESDEFSDDSIEGELLKL